MPEYELKKDSIDVPKNTGVEGFLHTVRVILKMPRVQSIHIDASGKVSYERYVQQDEPVELGDVGFEDLEPWHIIRNRDVEELIPNGTDPATVVMGMFNMAQREGFIPTSFVTGANSIMKIWMSTGGRPIPDGKQIFGLPIYYDRNTPDTVLIMTVGYTKDAGLIDTQKSYKIEMESPELPDNTVEVL